MDERNLQIKEVNFNGDLLLAAQDNQSKIYVGVRYICNGVGFTKSQKDTQIQKVQLDEVLRMGCVKFDAGVFEPDNEVVAIQIDFLPLWLAKISITPTMKRENPVLTEKLINYQLKAKDVLAAAFLPKQYQSADIAAVLSQLQNMQAQLDQNTKSLALLADERREHLTEIASLSYDLKTQIQIHPLAVKRERVLYKITNEIFKEEFHNPETSDLYKKAIEQISSMTLPELRKCIRKLGSQDFGNEFTVTDYSVSSIEYNRKHIENIQYTHSPTLQWVIFVLASTYYYLYYNKVALDMGYFEERYKTATNKRFQGYDISFLGHDFNVYYRCGIIDFTRYDFMVDKQEDLSISDYLTVRELTFKILTKDGGSDNA